MLLTAAMIVKNEERFLDGCLSSLAGLVDEIVVVDTGSDDKSKTIAAQHGARVDEMPWRDDFAAARNRALELARGEWILYIDADERVRPGSAANVRARLENPAALADYVWLRPRPEHTAYRVLRLFRNHPDIRFEGVIHESMWPSLNRYRALAGGDIGLSELRLDHDGYEGDLSAKHARNLPLLLRSVLLDPLRIYAWCHLAETYLALGCDELAMHSWEQAVAIVRSHGNELGDAALAFAGLLNFQRARGRDASRLLREARERFPGDIHLIQIEGESLMQARDYRGALYLFERLLQFRGADALELPVAYNQRLFDVYAYSALAACHFHLKEYFHSARFYRLASDCDPDSKEYRVKEALCSRLDRQQMRGAA